MKVKLILSSSKKIYKSLEIIYRLHLSWNEPSDKVWSQSGVTINLPLITKTLGRSDFHGLSTVSSLYGSVRGRRLLNAISVKPQLPENAKKPLHFTEQGSTDMISYKTTSSYRIRNFSLPTNFGSKIFSRWVLRMVASSFQVRGFLKSTSNDLKSDWTSKIPQNKYCIDSCNFC